MIVAAGTVHWDNGWQAITDPSAPFANERVIEASNKLGIVKEMFQEYTNYDYITLSGSVVMLNNGIEHSIVGVIKGMLFRVPTLLRGMEKGYIPTTIKGSMTTMPADFLVDADGIVHQEYYGKDEGDHLPFEKIKEFSHQQSLK